MTVRMIPSNGQKFLPRSAWTQDFAGHARAITSLELLRQRRAARVCMALVYGLYAGAKRLRIRLLVVFFFCLEQRAGAGVCAIYYGWYRYGIMWYFDCIRSGRRGGRADSRLGHFFRLVSCL